MTKTTLHARALKRSLERLKSLHETAKERGESETYLALCRFKIDELEAALAREERRAA